MGWSHILGFAGLMFLAFQLCEVVQLFQALKCACVVTFALSPPPPPPPPPSGGCGMYVGW